MESFGLTILVFDGSPDIYSIPIITIESTLSEVSESRAYEVMIKNVQDLQRDNPGRNFKFYAWLTNKDGEIITNK